MKEKINNNFSKNTPIVMKIIPYIFCYFIFSFLGWVLETIYCSFALGEFVKRGFLYSPMCPIYGTGALILTSYLDHSKSKNNYIKLFIIFIVIFSVFEYFVGFAFDALFAQRWWDYSDYKYNLNGRITVLNSFFWGVITIAFRKFLYPLIHIFKEKLLNKIPGFIQIIIAIILCIGISVDFILSCIKYLKLN